MESISSSNIESDQNLKKNQGGDEKKSHVNDIDVVYFECKNCQTSFTIRRIDQENVDPNSERQTARLNNCFRTPYLLELLLASRLFDHHYRHRQCIQ